jgi:hypothetical protein
VVTRYGPLGPIWNIASAVHLNEVANLPMSSMVQVTRLVGVSVRQVRKDAKLLLEIGDPFNQTVGVAEGRPVFKS